MKHTKKLAAIAAALTMLAGTSAWAACAGGANTGGMNFNSGTGTWQSCKSDGTWTDISGGGGGGGTASCVTQYVAWGGACNGTATAGTHGTSRSLNYSDGSYQCGNQGSATFTCTNGVWSITAGGSCTYIGSGCSSGDGG
jgi:hypothetical protein